MAGVDWKIYPECVSSAYVCVGKGTRLPVDAESTFMCPTCTEDGCHSVL